MQALISDVEVVSLVMSSRQHQLHLCWIRTNSTDWCKT